MTRRVKKLAIAIMIGLGCLTSGAIGATDFPTRPITLVVPFPAGGPSDTVARIVAERMRAALVQPLIVENISGAGGTIGLARVASSEPDGYTLVIGNWASHVGAIDSFKVSYDVVNDFEPVAMLAVAPVIFVGKSALPADDLHGLIAWLRQNPGKASAATSGPGSLAHLACKYFQSRTGTRFLLAPYRGAAPSLQDLVAAHVDLLCGIDGPTAMPFVRSGQIKALAVLQQKRWPQAPEVPTVDQAGVAGLYVVSWNALWAPRGTSQAIIAKLAAAAVESLEHPSVHEQLSRIGQEIPPRNQQNPKGLASYYKSELDKWLPMIKAQNVQPQ
jgi:tripartite-type tricarboxylate transporter receptor subunit TctC